MPVVTEQGAPRHFLNIPFPPRTDGPSLALPRTSADNGRMDILLNGEPRTLVAPASVLQLLQAEGLQDRRVAVEVNGEIVPRSRHGEWALAAGDHVEIVHALGGG